MDVHIRRLRAKLGEEHAVMPSNAPMPAAVREAGGARTASSAKRQRAVGALAVALIGGTLLAACGGSSTTGNAGSHPATTVAGSLTEYSGPGPYAAGTFEYNVGGDPVFVWYPVEKSAVGAAKPYTYRLTTWIPSALQSLVPASFADTVTEDAYYGLTAATGSFPVVMFSHGYGGYPEQSSFLTAHLATWGMIVVAPEQLERDLDAVFAGTSKQVNPPEDVVEQLGALAYVKRLDTTPGSLLDGRVDTSKVAALGHSAGGGTAVLLASADPSILGWVALAGVPVKLPKTPVPSMMISGSADKTVPTTEVRKFYGTVTGRKTFIVMDGYGHNVFSDVCTINHAHGGITAAIEALHLPVPPAILTLGTDGCSAPDLYPPTAWPFIDLAVTAQLRYDFGQVTSLAGLQSALAKAATAMRFTYQSAGY